MELIPIACHHCGAPLQVPPQADLVTCQHCRTQLAVCRNESVAWTERIDEIDERTEELAGNVAWLYFQRDLEALDRSWLAQQQQSLPQPPRRSGAAGGTDTYFGGIIIASVLILSFVVALNGAIFIGVWLSLAGFTVGLIVELIEGQTRGHQRAQRLREALRYGQNREMSRRLYEQQRMELHQSYYGAVPPDNSTSDIDLQPIDGMVSDTAPSVSIRL